MKKLHCTECAVTFLHKHIFKNWESERRSLMKRLHCTEETFTFLHNYILKNRQGDRRILMKKLHCAESTVIFLNKDILKNREWKKGQSLMKNQADKNLLTNMIRWCADLARRLSNSEQYAFSINANNQSQVIKTVLKIACILSVINSILHKNKRNRFKIKW